MDVIIPAHNLKTVSSALATLSKVGKYLYIEFDPLAGLTFRTLNDGKSSFAQFHFDVGFFERCSSPPGSRLRQRVRVRSDGTAGPGHGEGNDIPNASSRTRNGRRNRKRGRSRARAQPPASTAAMTNSTTQTQHNNDDGNGNGLEDEKYLCRVLIRTVSSILRPRKGLQSLRIRSTGACGQEGPNNSDDNYDNSDDDHDLRMQLSFEFRIKSEGIMRITHKVGVSESESVIAEASRSGCSEIVAEPRQLLKMIDPVKSTEVALIVNDVDKRVTATSFHYADVNIRNNNNNSSSSRNRNMVLNASAASVLKTETSIDCDEFDEFLFSDGISHSDLVGEDVPEGVENEVALVFSAKEARAMIQFCCGQQQNQNIDDGDLRTIVSFHWGGRPIVIETEGEAYKAELILSTVAHGLLNGVDLTSRGQKRNNRGTRNSTSSLQSEARSRHASSS